SPARGMFLLRGIVLAEWPAVRCGMPQYMWFNPRRAMRRRRRSIVTAAVIVGVLLGIRLWLSASALPTGRAGMLAVAIVIAVVLVVAALAIKLLDVGGRRDDRAARAQRRVTRRLRGALGVLPISVVACGSPSARAPLLIELTGSVGTEVLHE